MRDQKERPDADDIGAGYQDHHKEQSRSGVNNITQLTGDINDVFRSLGVIQPDRLLLNGNIQRVSTEHKPKGTNGWYFGFEGKDHQYVQVGNWEHGGKVEWTNKEGGVRNIPANTRRAYRKKYDDARRQERLDAEAEAERFSKLLKPVPKDFSYLTQKDVGVADGVGFRVSKIHIPVFNNYDLNGNRLEDPKLVGYQNIPKSGKPKRFITGTRMTGSFFIIKGDDSAKIVCEGYATGYTVWLATGHTVVVAFNACNLKTVADQLDGAVYVAADCDKPHKGAPEFGGTGHQQAEATGRFWFSPQRQGKDFNDIGEAATREKWKDFIRKHTPLDADGVIDYLKSKEDDLKNLSIREKTTLLEEVSTRLDENTGDVEKKLLAREIKSMLDLRHIKDVEEALHGPKLELEHVYDPKMQKRLDYFNDRFACVMIGGKFAVIDVAGNGVPQTYQRQDFLHWWENETYQVLNDKGGETTKSIGEIWIKGDRTTYEKMVFDPSEKAPDNHFNLFRGLPIQPGEGGKWNMLEELMKDVICGGDEDHYRYMEMLFARMVQDPGGNRPGVCFVMRGPKGTGKGQYMAWPEAIFGEYYARVDKSKNVTGDFNSIVGNKVLLFADEAFFAGDPSEDATLKGLITEPTYTFSRKYFDAINLDNHLNIVMASNSDWVVRATDGERRYMVVDVSDKKKGDTQFFGALEQQRINGGVEAWMSHLLQVEVDMDYLRKPIVTQALLDQIEHNLNPVQRFWHQVMDRGHIFETEWFVGEPGTGSTPTIKWEERNLDRGKVYSAFQAVCKENNIRRPDPQTLFFKKTYSMFGGKDKLTKKTGGIEYFKPLPLDWMKTIFNDYMGAGFF